MPAALLEVDDLTKRFGGFVALENISLSVAPGERVGLIGPNGSGKSTVMKLIMGIERPTAGSVKLDGVEIANWPSHRVAREGIGIVFQHSRPLHRQTVLENIKLALLPDNLLKLIADPAVEVRWARDRYRPAGASRLYTELFAAIEAETRKLYGVEVLPTMSTGASDKAQIRSKGVQCYGIGPAVDIEDGARGFGAHSDQERILEAELHRFVRFQYDAVMDVARAR